MEDLAAPRFQFLNKLRFGAAVPPWQRRGCGNVKPGRARQRTRRISKRSDEEAGRSRAQLQTRYSRGPLCSSNQGAAGFSSCLRWCPPTEPPPPAPTWFFPPAAILQTLLRCKEEIKAFELPLYHPARSPPSS